MVLFSTTESNSLVAPEKENICKKCLKPFGKLEYLRAHIVRHCENRSKICNICKVNFFDLRRHMLLHNGKDQYKCTICDKSFSQRSILKDHNVTHTDIRAFSCNLCDKSFKKSSALKGHIETHFGEKSN